MPLVWGLDGYCPFFPDMTVSSTRSLHCPVVSCLSETILKFKAHTCSFSSLFKALLNCCPREKNMCWLLGAQSIYSSGVGACVPRYGTLGNSLVSSIGFFAWTWWRTVPHQDSDGCQNSVQAAAVARVVRLGIPEYIWPCGRWWSVSDRHCFKSYILPYPLLWPWPPLHNPWPTYF